MREPQGNVKTCDDHELWRALADRKDEQAFTALYRRHEQAAYNLAFEVTHNQAEAEEAVQEAMVRVWKNASSFRSEGSVRGWVLRIVARESLRALKRRRGLPAMVEQELPESEGESPASVAERGELINALREELNRLPELDRKLLALHFGGGLSQEEIGEALNYSQQSVSLRIQKTLSRLRSQLTFASLAVSGAVLESKGLQEIFLNGNTVPPDLAGKVLSKFSTVAKESLRRGVAPAGSATGSVASSWVVAGVLALAGMTGLYYYEGLRSPSHSAPNAPAKASRLHGKWSCENGPLADFEVLQGSWAWKAGDGARHTAMSPPMGRDVYFQVPVEMPARPVLLSIRAQNVPLNTSAVAAQVFWLDGLRALPSMLWITENTSMSGDHDLVIRYYFVEQWAVIYFNDTLVAVSENSQAYPTRTIVCGLRNLEVVEVEIQELEREDVPAALRTPEKLIENMGVAPKSTGGHLVGPAEQLK